MTLLTHPLLLPIALTFAAGCVCLLMPKRAERINSWFSVIVCAVTVYLVVPLIKADDILFDAGGALSLRLDPLSAIAFIPSAVFGLLIALYAAGWMANHAPRRRFHGYLLWTLSATFITLLANDLLLFVTGWGFLALMLYLMIDITGPTAAAAALTC